MKISDLKSPYRELAELRREQDKTGSVENILSEAFVWEDTPEDADWWDEVDEGEQPEIPQSSLDELRPKPDANANAKKIAVLAERISNIESELSDADWYENLPDGKKVYDKKTTEHLLRAEIRELYNLIRGELK